MPLLKINSTRPAYLKKLFVSLGYLCGVLDDFENHIVQHLGVFLKIDNKIYDDFYVEIYDQLQKTEERTSWEVQQLVNSIDFNKNSVILDIGCGTGHLVNKLDAQRPKAIKAKTASIRAGVLGYNTTRCCMAPTT